MNILYTIKYSRHYWREKERCLDGHWIPWLGIPGTNIFCRCSVTSPKSGTLNTELNPANQVILILANIDDM